MSISKEAYDIAEEYLNLHPATLVAFNKNGGAQTIFTSRDRIHSDVTNGFWIVIKATQKIEIANWTLSMYYDPGTGWINAFVCGHGLVRTRQAHVEEGHESQPARLLAGLQASAHLWHHPLLLPTILLQNYNYKTHLHAERSIHEMLKLEDQLGYTQTGQHRSRGPKDPDLDTKLITIDLTTALTQIFNMDGVCRWLEQVSEFLLDTESTLSKTTFQKRHAITSTTTNIDYQSWQSDHIIREALQFESVATHSFTRTYELARSRLEAQVNLVYSINSQNDNKLNFEVASSSKQDSISVTTFTFITALFLPGTFVATVFSMSMFDWNTDQDASSTRSQDPSAYVSGKFWIYWAVAIPLTAITMIGWFVWYGVAKKNWQRSIEPFRKGDVRRSKQTS